MLGSLDQLSKNTIDKSVHIVRKGKLTVNDIVSKEKQKTFGFALLARLAALLFNALAFHLIFKNYA